MLAVRCGENEARLAFSREELFERLAGMRALAMKKYGVRSDAEMDALAEKWEKREDAERIDRAVRAAVPPEFLGKTFDAFSALSQGQRKAKAVCVSFAKRAAEGGFCSLVMLGAKGTGKTHLACAAVRAVAETGVAKSVEGVSFRSYGGARYLQSQQLCELLAKAERRNEARTRSQVAADLGSLRLLAIDEIGRGTARRDEEAKALFQAVDARYVRRVPTLLVSNMDWEEFADFAGSATVDRLAESAKILRFEPLGSDGASWRQRRSQAGVDLASPPTDGEGAPF